MKKFMDVGFVLLGVIVMVIGIIRWLSPVGVPEVGMRLNLVNAVPGYAIVSLGGVIVIIAIAAGFIMNKKSGSSTAVAAG